MHPKKVTINISVKPKNNEFQFFICTRDSHLSHSTRDFSLGPWLLN